MAMLNNQMVYIHIIIEQCFFYDCIHNGFPTISMMWIWPLHGYYMIVYIYIFYCKIWGKTHVGCFWQLLKYVLCITALAYDSSCSAGCGTTTHWVDKCCRPQACESTALKQQQQQQQGTNSRLIRTGWWFQPLWNILVSWDDYSQYVEKKTCSKPPTI